MKIMIEACTYNKYNDIVITIDGDGSILHVSVSKINSQTSDVYYGDGITVDTDSIGKDVLAKLEEQESEIAELKAQKAQAEDDVAFWKAKAKGEM